MTGIPPTGSFPPGVPDDGAEEDAGWLTPLLTDLADDPAAPPSTVSPLSVIAAAKRAAAGGPGPAPDADTAADPSVVAAGAVSDPDEPVVDLRSRRRRRLIAGLVAAACIFGVGVVVVPLALNGNSSVTSSSADANRAAEAADSAAESGAAAAAAPAPDQQAQDNAELAAPAGTEAQGSASSTDQAGPEAAGSTPAVDGGPGDAGVLGCWPPLGDAVTAGLLAALPAGAFGAADPLVDGCDPAGVAGGVLSGQTAAIGLVVRVTVAEPGACVSSVGCAPLDGGYLVADAPGGPVVYAYGNGYQVAVGGSSAQAPGGSGLSSAQELAAAQAVLVALT